ncbi:hypothetical protein MCAP1_000226 [Malassezia caprae]|uniref:Uncharacterized protein n=1 Tax=Malassezia caprae TaxID=1381934 RepID=A0AAF0E4I4_9BASI|nr:hypothetical protein MCAP1_000226 [Malassezia caprae]
MPRRPAQQAAPRCGGVWLLSLCVVLVVLFWHRDAQAPNVPAPNVPAAHTPSVPMAHTGPAGSSRLVSSAFQLRHGVPPPWDTRADEDRWRVGTRFASPVPRASLVARCVWAPVHVLVVRPVLWLARLFHTLLACLRAMAYVALAPVRSLCMAIYTITVAWPWQALKAMAPLLYQLYVLGGVAVLLGLGLGALSVVLLRGEHGLYTMRARRRGA